jgi:cytochrome c5
MKNIALILLVSSISFNAFSEGVGERVYNQVCFTCHDQGVFGAPKLGEALDWTDRVSKGKSVLNYNAIEGYAGSKGFMPPRGGDLSLSDLEVKEAVQYMIDKSW